MHALSRRRRPAGTAGPAARTGALVAMVVMAAAVTATASGASAQAEPGAPEVIVTELRPLPGTTNTEAHAINDEGQVVGKSGDLPVLWEDGQPTPLPITPGGTTLTTHINDRGDVVVGSRWYDGSAMRHAAYLWRDGEVTDLNGPDDDVTVTDLNESGQILLTRSRGGVSTHELWQDGVATDLRLPAPPPEQSIKLAHLSDGGHVIGEYGQEFDFIGFPFWVATGGLWRWHPGGFDRVTTSAPFAALGKAVNRHGQVVGTDLSGGLLWSDGRTSRLGFQPEDVNDRGQVVGTTGLSRAVVWEDGRTTDLGGLRGSSFTRPGAINERGQVLGYSAFEGDPQLIYHTWIWSNGHMIDLGVGDGPYPAPKLDDLNDEGQAIGTRYESSTGRTALMWTIHDDGGPVDPPSDQQCVTATNQAHVQAGRATSWLSFAWAAGSGAYLGLASQTTSLQEAARGRWEPVASC